MALAVRSRPFRWKCSSLRRIPFLALEGQFMFTEAELEFGVNFGIKYRMGRDAEGGED